MRPIDADALKDSFENLAYDDWNQGAETTLANAFREAADVVEDAPTIDAVEVVRCRDCIHRPEGTGANHDLKFPDEVCPCQCVDDFWYSWKPNEDWFCASGERG